MKLQAYKLVRQVLKQEYHRKVHTLTEEESRERKRQIAQALTTLELLRPERVEVEEQPALF